jgi:hypothetical protein
VDFHISVTLFCVFWLVLAIMSGLYFDKNRFGRRGVYVGCWFRWATMRIDFVPFDMMARTSQKTQKRVTEI